MSDSDCQKEMVYLAYRDIFKDNLAKLRNRSKIRRVVQKHKDHLHHKQLADSMDLEKVIKILGEILAGRLFESDLAAKATFPTLFSTGQLGNNTALIVKCVEEDFESECGQRDRTIPDAPIPNSTSLESAPTVGQHRIDGKSGRIRKPTGAATKPIGVTHEFGEGKEASPNEVLGKDIEKGKKGLKRKRDCDVIPANPTYLPSRIQHLILTQAQRLLEECCYHFAEKWFPTMLETNGWDAPEAVELTKWWQTLSKCDIPATAIDLSHGKSLATLFKRAISIRHCAVHRRPQIPVKKVEEMVRDAWLLAKALQDDVRTAQILHWHRELEKLVAHLQLRTNSQREVAEAQLQNIHNAKVEIEEMLAELESRESQLIQSLEAEGRTHRPIDIEALQPLEEALRRPTLTEGLPVTAQNQIRQWIENSVGRIIGRTHPEALKG